MDKRSSHHISFCVKGVHRREIIAYLDNEDIYVSGGSACHASDDLPSHVLVAMKIPLEYIHGSVRITLSHTVFPEEITSYFIPRLQNLLTEVSKSTGLTRG